MGISESIWLSHVHFFGKDHVLLSSVIDKPAQFAILALRPDETLFIENAWDR